PVEARRGSRDARQQSEGGGEGEPGRGRGGDRGSADGDAQPYRDGEAGHQQRGGRRPVCEAEAAHRARLRARRIPPTAATMIPRVTPSTMTVSDPPLDLAGLSAFFR